MVKRFLLLTLLFVTGIGISEKIFAQHFLGALSMGINLTQVDGDLFYGYYKIGLNVGPMVAVPFGKNKNWSVRVNNSSGAQSHSEPQAAMFIRKS